ncbi:hypothetical protein A2U01_0115847, partial [Trifolium medium]|nr:hypothetical protein [Trifolium medium]
MVVTATSVGAPTFTLVAVSSSVADVTAISIGRGELSSGIHVGRGGGVVG